MMIGRVLTSREPVLRITVSGPLGTRKELDALVDSGFTGLLCLPSKAISELGLSFAGLASGTLADGSRVVTRRFAAVVLWHEQPREVFVLESEGGPMIEMSLLYGNRVAIEARDGGELMIEPLYSPPSQA